jgi:hypothetical protein
LDRYAYVNNSPINYIDPSGHCSDPTEYACRKSAERAGNEGLLTPGQLVENDSNRRVQCELSGHGNCGPTYEHSKLTDDIEKYLETHPDYDPKKDGMVDKFGNWTSTGYDFNYQREVYWKQRARDAGLCTLLCQGIAGQLTKYYDYHETFTNARRKGNMGNIMLDVIGIPLGFTGEGYINVSAKGAFAAISVSSALVSGSAAAYHGDVTGTILSGAGVIPVVGGFASAISLARDLYQFDYFEYVPPIPR